MKMAVVTAAGPRQLSTAAASLVLAVAKDTGTSTVCDSPLTGSTGQSATQQFGLTIQP